MEGRIELFKVSRRYTQTDMGIKKKKEKKRVTNPIVRIKINNNNNNPTVERQMLHFNKVIYMPYDLDSCNKLGNLNR